MADEKESIIFELKVDQHDALTELERFKRSIIQTKQEQQELSKAYKAGNITLDEYVKEQVRLEAILKKQSSSYGTLQKSVTGVKTQMDKLIDSNKKISQSFKDTAGQMNIAGVNIGQLTSKLASFANPATAAVGIVGALGAAYARSTIGAKDLEFAQNQLAAATTLVTNELAGLISSSEDGEGALTKLLNSTLKFVGSTSVGLGLKLIGVDLNKIADKSKSIALSNEELQDLMREEVGLRADANERLSENQELLTEIQSDQTKFNDKIEKSNQIIENIRKSQTLLTNEKANEYSLILKQLDADRENEALKDKEVKIRKELSTIEKDSEKRIQTVLRLQQNLTDTEAKRLKAIKDAFSGVNLGTDLISGLSVAGAGQTGFKKSVDTSIVGGTLARIDSAKVAADALAQIEKGITHNAEQESKNRIVIQENEDAVRLQAAAIVLGSLEGLAKEGTELQKALALFAIGADTAVAVTKGIAASQSVPYPGNLIAMASTIAAVLGAIANARNTLGFAEGGWTGPGSKHQAVGLVHADEYVVPQKIVHSPSAQHHLTALESMRMRGYSDGGLVTNSMTAETNQSLVIANSMKRSPRPVVEVVQIAKGLKAVEVKQKASRGKPFSK